MCVAYEKAIEDFRFKEFEINTEKSLMISDIKLSQIFDSNFQSRLDGYTKLFDSNGVPSFNKTAFGEDAKLVVIFIKESNGNIKLKTMYPDP